MLAGRVASGGGGCYWVACTIVCAGPVGVAHGSDAQACEKMRERVGRTASNVVSQTISSMGQQLC